MLRYLVVEATGT